MAEGNHSAPSALASLKGILFSYILLFMRRTLFYSICAGLLLTLVLLPISKVAAVKSAPKVQLLETGQFHGDEVKARTGERWLGLFPVANGFALLPSTISVDAVFDPIVDAETKETSGKKVTVSRNTDPIFLLKGAAMLRPGPVVTIFQEQKTLGNGATIDLRLNGNRYQLKVVSHDPKPSNFLLQNTKLVLTMGKTSQTLISLKEHTDAGWFLFWAGDIDRDGKLDLYLDLAPHYNVSRRTLFLSSQAGKGKLVKELVRFVTVGC